MTRSERARPGAGPHPDVRCVRLLAVALALVLSSLCTTARAEVSIHDSSGAFAGYNLSVSHDSPGAVLMNMDGDILHRWTCRFEDAFPAVALADDSSFSSRWTSARLLPDGDVLGIFGGLGMVRLDRSSRILWAHEGGEHDDIAVTEDGTIYVLGGAMNKVAWVNQKEPVLEDFVFVLDAEGTVVNRFSLLTAILSSDLSNVTKTARMARSGHVLQANSLDVLDGSVSDRIPSFGSGNVLVSLRGLNTVAVLDVASGSLVWTQFGMWLDQLHSTCLPGGNILVLEYVGGDPKVIEFDPATQEVTWSYRRDSASPIDGWWGGSCQRLPNGNTMISESGRGRAFEVTREGDVVWEYVSSASGSDRDPAATPFELVRIAPEFIAGWIGN